MRAKYQKGGKIVNGKYIKSPPTGPDKVKKFISIVNTPGKAAVRSLDSLLYKMVGKTSPAVKKRANKKDKVLNKQAKAKQRNPKPGPNEYQKGGKRVKDSLIYNPTMPNTKGKRGNHSQSKIDTAIVRDSTTIANRSDFANIVDWNNAKKSLQTNREYRDTAAKTDPYDRAKKINKMKSKKQMGGSIAERMRNAKGPKGLPPLKKMTGQETKDLGKQKLKAGRSNRKSSLESIKTIGKSQRQEGRALKKKGRKMKRSDRRDKAEAEVKRTQSWLQTGGSKEITFGAPKKMQKGGSANTKADTLRAIKMRDSADWKGKQTWTEPKAEKILADRDKVTGTQTFNGVPYGEFQGDTKRSLAKEYEAARKKEAAAKKAAKKADSARQEADRDFARSKKRHSGAYQKGGARRKKQTGGTATADPEVGKKIVREADANQKRKKYSPGAYADAGEGAVAEQAIEKANTNMFGDGKRRGPFNNSSTSDLGDEIKQITAGVKSKIAGKGYKRGYNDKYYEQVKGQQQAHVSDYHKANPTKPFGHLTGERDQRRLELEEIKKKKAAAAAKEKAAREKKEAKVKAKAAYSYTPSPKSAGMRKGGVRRKKFLGGLAGAIGGAKDGGGIGGALTGALGGGVLGRVAGAVGGMKGGGGLQGAMEGFKSGAFGNSNPMGGGGAASRTAGNTGATSPYVNNAAPDPNKGQLKKGGLRDRRKAKTRKRSKK